MANTSNIAAVLKQAVDSGDVPGVVAAAATRDGPIFEGGYGKRALPSGESMTADTVVWIASMTKAITGACAMQQVERGQLSLDAPIKTILPELATPMVLEGFDADGNPKTRPARRDITLRHLLTHTSGCSYDFWSADITRYLEKTGTPPIISCANAALNVPLIFDPGEKWEYGVGIDFAGKAVEKVTGQKLGRYMKENIFDPLGMKDTAFKIGDEQRKRLAKIHARTPDGLQATDTEIPQEPEFEMGGGGLYGTVGDYLRFAQVFLHDGTFNGAQILEARDRQAHEPERSRRCARPPAEDGAAADLERRRFHRRNAMGAVVPHQPAAVADRTLRGVACLGGSRQFVLLDRSSERRNGRLRNANLAVFRREVRSHVPGVRDRGVPGDLRTKAGEVQLRLSRPIP